MDVENSRFGGMMSAVSRLVEIKQPVENKMIHKTTNRGYNLGTTAKEAAMVSACVAKRRQ